MLDISAFTCTGLDSFTDCWDFTGELIYFILNNFLPSASDLLDYDDTVCNPASSKLLCDISTWSQAYKIVKLSKQKNVSNRDISQLEAMEKCKCK